MSGAFGQADLGAVSDAIDSTGIDGWDYLGAAIIFVAAVAISRLARLIVKRLLDRSRADSFLGDLVGRVAGYVIVAFGFVYALESLGVAIAPLLGALGIVGVAIAFALQDILENFVAGLLLQLRRPFTAGDEIETRDHEGTVTEVDARAVTLRTPDGETVRIPSADVIKNPIVNHTQVGRRRTTVEVGVAYDTDLEDAIGVALGAVASVGSVLAEPRPRAFVHTFGESSIDIAVHFWHRPSILTRWETRHEVSVAIHRAFREHSIVIPFPQRVLRHLDAAEPEPDDDQAETRRS